MPKQSSPELSSLASRVMRIKPTKNGLVSGSDWNNLLEKAQKLAGSVLSQDEESASG